MALHGSQEEENGLGEVEKNVYMRPGWIAACMHVRSTLHITEGASASASWN